MNKKLVGIIATSAVAVGISCFASISSSKFTNTPANAVTDATVYYACPSDLADEVWAHIHYGTNSGDPWERNNATKTGDFINSWPIYSVSFTDKWDGIATIKFEKKKNGSQTGEETKIYETWTKPEIYNGKYFLNGTNQIFEGWKTVYLKVWTNWNNPSLYVWQGNGSSGDVKAFGDWPGLSLTNVDTGARFNDAKLYKADIPYFNGNGNYKDIKFIYHDKGDGGNNQSNDLIATASNLYYQHTQETGWVGDADLGKAADFMYGFNEARMNVQADSTVRNYSICGLDASKWVSDYNNLDISDSAKTILDNSTINTYTNYNNTTLKNFTISEMMSYLTTLIPSGNESRHFDPSTGSDTTTIIAASSLLAVLGISFALISKKKKKQII